MKMVTEAQNPRERGIIVLVNNCACGGEEV